MESSAAPNFDSSGNAITGGYTGNSFAVKALIVFFSGLTIYNATELLLLIFFTFSRYKGLYFYSLLVSSICTIPYALGFLFKFLLITTGNARWLSVTLITVGWYGMVTGQSVVLWSRLHLLVDRGEKGLWTLRWTKWMIIIDAIILHIPTTTLTYGSNGSISTETFVRGYNVMEKIQMCGFFLQEVILSTLYIVYASRLLRNSMRPDAKWFLIQLLGLNVIIIFMDIALLASEAASLYLYETILKGTIYSIKLKLEFAILGKLVDFVGGRPGTSTANEERWRAASNAYLTAEKAPSGSQHKIDDHDSGPAVTNSFDAGGNTDLADFVDLSKSKTNTSYATHHSDLSPAATGNDAVGFNRKKRSTIRSGRGVTDDDIDLARFQHIDNVSLPEEDEKLDDENYAYNRKSSEGSV